MRIINKYGQYFTTNINLKRKLYEFIMNNPQSILEPSIGRGDLVLFIKDKLPNVSFEMYEIDKSIDLLDGINKEQVTYGDFIDQNLSHKYMTIIGNPPYVRTKKGNLYIDFIKKCVDVLDVDGELIFIVPSDFFKLTSAAQLLNKMMEMGSFTHIYHPHDEKLFEKATIDVLIFRYCKNSSLPKDVIYNDEHMYIKNSNGLITFDSIVSDEQDRCLFRDYFDIYVGLVSGKESVFKNEELGNISILNGENEINKYIYIDKYPCIDEEVNTYLLGNKHELIKRGIRKFDEKNWFQWGAPRNIKIMEKFYAQKCIFVYNLTRKTKVAFRSTVQYFGGGLIMLKPKNGKCDIDKCIDHLNSKEFQNCFRYSGRFKIGQRQLCNSYLPIHCVSNIE